MMFHNHNRNSNVNIPFWATFLLSLLLTSHSSSAQQNTTSPDHPWEARDPKDQQVITVTDGILLNDALSAAFGVPQYDFSNEDDTVEVFRFLTAPELVPEEWRVTCEMQCDSSDIEAENLFMTEGPRPLNANNFSVFKTDDCPIENLEWVMEKTTSLYVYATSVADDGLKTAQIKCTMEEPLTISATAEEDKTTAAVSKPTFDEMDQQNTLALWRFTTGDIPKDTTVTCTLECDNTVTTILESIALKEKSRPIDFDDHDEMIEGICPISATWRMTAKDQLYIMANSKEPLGLLNAKITCDAIPNIPSPTPAPTSPPTNICIPLFYLKKAYNRITDYFQANQDP